jgi:deoxyribodipyrimidine photo-lyase
MYDMFGLDEERIRPLNQKGMRKGDYVLYWMQQSQRSRHNHALEYAVSIANERSLPVVVLFCLMDTYPEANLRHYTFMLEGLEETRQSLDRRGITMVIIKARLEDAVVKFSQNASCVVCDRGYLRHQKLWRRHVAEKVQCQVVQVESDVVVPVNAASNKAEFSARTLRPKIHKSLHGFLHAVEEIPLKKRFFEPGFDSIDPNDIEAVLRGMDIDRSVTPVSRFFRGGTFQAVKRFKKFTQDRLMLYAGNSNQPQTDDISHMSPYLHFGQISSVYLALQVKSFLRRHRQDTEAYLEQLIVRRELAMNFVEFSKDYDTFSCIPAWALKTLTEHAPDRREHLYTLDEFEKAQTHDEYWNAAMNEMKITGFMHNYMRMYWGKKVLEWSRSPEEAFNTLLHLNNKYFLDGRDANSYTGVAWIFGLHDRAWGRREVFGTVRYMAASGLERKCDIKAYVRKIDQLKQKSNPL